MGRLEGSVHTQLSDFKFIPSEAASPKLKFNLFKSKETIDNCRTLEAFVASVIEDKPANIDRFFKDYVLTLFVACGCLESAVLAVVGSERNEKNQAVLVGYG